MDRISSDFSRHSTALEVVEGLDLAGRTALITGGAASLGLETSKALASAGARVWVAVRDPHKAQEGLLEIRAAGRGDAEALPIDLADLQSVRACAKAWGDRPLDILINNAGVMACPHQTTRQGLEMQIGVNHFGHFLLTTLLVPALEAGARRGGANSRVVVLSSGAHRFSDVEFDDIHFERRPYDKWQAYGQSKTANALFAVELTRRFADRGIFANSVMPGRIRTSLSRHMSEEELSQMSSGLHSYKSPQQGAATTAWAAAGRELDGVGGLYLEDCAQAMPAEPGQDGGVADYAFDPVAAERLWAVSETTTGAASTP